MDSASQWFVLLLPFLIFIAGFAVLFFGIHRFIGRLQKNLVNGISSKEIHLRSPWGTLDVHRDTALDPRLARILMYPGAAPLESGVAQYDAELHLLNREFKGATAQYWTSTPEQIVCEFYQRELPDWQRKSEREFVKQSDGYLQGVKVQTSGDRTIIEIGIRTCSLAEAPSNS
ncbi:MAG TPA: hypothetical protein VFA68_16650 [Terriglobales bacterium]|nr:hypothetical protein [Terriglobales bacterium]